MHVSNDIGIDIRGNNELLIKVYSQPYCIVELKRHSENAIEHARNQALIYTAGRGVMRNSPMRAVVTDLHEWQFLRVTADTFEVSTIHSVEFKESGIPKRRQLAKVLKLFCNFLLGRHDTDHSI